MATFRLTRQAKGVEKKVQERQHLRDLRLYDGQNHPVKVILPDGRVIYQDDVPFEDIPKEHISWYRLFRDIAALKRRKA